MIVRALDQNGDWTFGKGKNDYKSGLDAFAQSLQTRCSMILGDCFFAKQQGIDYFNLLGGGSALALNLAMSTTILNTENALEIKSLNFTVDENGNFTAEYSVLSTFGLVEGEVSAP